jgi:hypothetical protein
LILVVGGEVFDARANAFRLQSVDHGPGQDTAEEGIFREVLEVAAAQWASFDVQARAE